MKMKKAIMIIINILGWLFAVSTIGWMIYFFLVKDVNPIPTAAFAALSGIFFSNYYHIKKIIKEESKLYLEYVIDGFKKAHDMLADGNNKRINWVNASRILNNSIELSRFISEKEHKSVFENHELDYKIRFAKIIGYEDKNKTGSFFYGTKDSSIPIDEAARESTAPKKVSNDFTITSTLKEIPEEALKVIWEFTQFPKNYVERITQKFPDNIIELSYLLEMSYNGIYKYLKHKREYDSASGKLYPRKK